MCNVMYLNRVRPNHGGYRNSHSERRRGLEATAELKTLQGDHGTTGPQALKVLRAAVRTTELETRGNGKWLSRQVRGLPAKGLTKHIQDKTEGERLKAPTPQQAPTPAPEQDHRRTHANGAQDSQAKADTHRHNQDRQQQPCLAGARKNRSKNRG